MRACLHLVAGLALFAGVPCAAAPSYTDEAAPAASPSPEPAPEARERRLCRDQPVTGSRIKGKRICMTQKEWREYDAQTQVVAGSMQRRPTLRDQ